MPVESIHWHIDPPEFRDDVGALCEFGNVVLPLTENLLAPAFVRTDAKWPTKMIEDDRRIWKSPGKIGYLPHLRMVLPRFETQVAALQPAKTLAKLCRLIQICGRVGMRISYRGVWIKTARVPDAAKTRWGRSYMRLQDFFDGCSQGQIGETDYARSDPSLAVLPACTLCGDAVDKLSLTYRFQ